MEERGRQSGSAVQNCFWSQLREFGCHLSCAPGRSLVKFPLISKSKSADKSSGSLFIYIGLAALNFPSCQPCPQDSCPHLPLPLAECCILVPNTRESGASLQALYTGAFGALLPAWGLLATSCPIMNRNNSIPTWSDLQLTWAT